MTSYRMDDQTHFLAGARPFLHIIMSRRALEPTKLPMELVLGTLTTNQLKLEANQ